MSLFGASAYDVNQERPDAVPFEEQLRGLENVIKAGKVRKNTQNCIVVVRWHGLHRYIAQIERITIVVCLPVYLRYPTSVWVAQLSGGQSCLRGSSNHDPVKLMHIGVCQGFRVYPKAILTNPLNPVQVRHVSTREGSKPYAKPLSPISKT